MYTGIYIDIYKLVYITKCSELGVMRILFRPCTGSKAALIMHVEE